MNGLDSVLTVLMAQMFGRIHIFYNDALYKYSLAQEQSYVSLVDKINVT